MRLVYEPLGTPARRETGSAGVRRLESQPTGGKLGDLDRRCSLPTGCQSFDAESCGLASTKIGSMRRPLRFETSAATLPTLSVRSASKSLS